MERDAALWGTTAAVIGAGVAGLAAGRALADAGARVSVFEKARGPGGRAATRREPGAQFDHGAQYVTVRDPAFRAQVADWEGRGVAAPWTGRVVHLGPEGLREAGQGDGGRWVGVPGMSALARDAVRGLAFAPRARAERLEPAPSGWRVRFATGAVAGPFTQVVVATAAPRAVPLLAEAAPGLAKPLAAVSMRPCQAVMALFEEPVGTAFEGAFVEGSPLAWAARNAGKPGRGRPEAWVLHAGPAWSAAHLEDDPESVARALLDAFAALLPHALPRLLHAAAHRWRHAATETPASEPFLYDPVARLGACGDWGGESRVESAWLSGRRLAEAMVAAGDPGRGPGSRGAS